jgi:rubrerythrin
MAMGILLFDDRNEPTWRDPLRVARTLRSFAGTEERGGLDLAAAARRVVDPWLREHLERHARDEIRHAELFRRRAAELLAPRPSHSPVETLAGDPTEGGGASHGFLRGSRIDEVGDVAFVAMVHVSEQRAARLFARLTRATAHDPETREIFDAILEDERYHVSYTRTALDRWRRAGRGPEVSRALSEARDERLLGAWKRAGARAATGVSRVLLRVAYFTVLVPFCLLARFATRNEAERPDRDPAAHLGSQYE